MPVTAKLSKLFYERLGEQVANELVDWFNAVDTTYRSDLRALNEQNFARFDAKLEQRLSELKAELRTELASKAEIARLATKEELKTEIARLATKEEIKTEIATLRVEWQSHKAELIKWMFLFWSGTTLAGLLYR
jgi:ABC-type phosphate transport system auxiliary subunit